MEGGCTGLWWRARLASSQAKAPRPPTPLPTVREQPLYETQFSWGVRWAWSEWCGLKADVLLCPPLIQSPSRGWPWQVQPREHEQVRHALGLCNGRTKPICRAPGAVLGASAPHSQIRPADGLWNRQFKSIGLNVDSATAS